MKISFLAVLLATTGSTLEHSATAFVLPPSSPTTTANSRRTTRPLAASTLSTPPNKTPRAPKRPEDDDEDEDNAKTTTTTTTSSSKSSSSNNKNNNNRNQPTTSTFRDRLGNSGIASAAAMATAAVNAAVSMKTLEAPNVQKSYIAMDTNATASSSAVDEEGLPLVYDKNLIEAYWSKERGALQQRWRVFAGKAVPFLTKLVTLFIRDGSITEDEIPGLSRQARHDLQDLGATFIKLGQMFSVRPDILPDATLAELTKLQDSVVPFDTETAVAQIERELGGPLGQFFTSISEEPVAAASLAQVYMATLNDGNNTRVAVKVQRPDVLGTVSKDLYVLRRAAEVFQGLIERFAPQQRTDYVALLNEWAIGFYTELDFQNEASNQRRLRNMLLEKNVTGVTVPRTYDDLCTRRILVSEWMDGKKLSDATEEQIGQVTPLAQEAFLTQLFEVGFFHADPHPGNLLLLNEPTESGATLALIDCGLMASIESTDRDNMISAVIHLANKDYASLVDDFMALKILPPDSDRATIIPLMDKALSPYVQGGGAKKYEEELRKLYGMEERDNMQAQVGGFQAMTQDALTVLNDVPFSIPPYFAILGRAIVTLEGIALTGNPDYGIIMESYPFIARKLLREGRPEIQKALQEVLYSSGSSQESSRFKLTRLLALLNNAAGTVATQEGAAFVDLDSIPENGLSLEASFRYVLSDEAESLRTLLEPEVDNIVDVLSRQILRRAMEETVLVLTPPRPPSLPLLGDIFPPSPKLDEVPLPILLPRLTTPPSSRGDSSNSSSKSGTLIQQGPPSVAVLTLRELVDTAAPKLSQEEEIFAIGLAEGAQEFVGSDLARLLKGEHVLSPQTMQLVLEALRSGAVGQSQVLSTDAARSVLNFVISALSQVPPTLRAGTSTTPEGNPRKGATSGGSSGSSATDIYQIIQNLPSAERARWDDILEELTRRALVRIVQRLEAVDRIA